MVKADAATLTADLTARPLLVDGIALPIVVSVGEVEQVYLPLAEYIREQARAERILVGIAGPPGSGKTVTVCILAQVLRLLGEDPAGIGLDGFHLANAVLRPRIAVDDDGQVVSLERRKGLPHTFDPLRFKAMLAGLRQTRSPLAFPAYDRARHDVVERAVTIAPNQRIVLVEGNFLFYDQGDWLGLSDLFDLRVFVATPPQACIENLRARHLRGGRDPEDTARHMRVIDLPNIPLILSMRPRAHVVIVRSDAWRAEKLEWQT